MRIALVIEAMDVGRGGREVSTSQIATELANRGHDVTILCEFGHHFDERVKIAPLGKRGMGKAGRLKAFAHAVEMFVTVNDFDIVHSMLALPGTNVYQLRSGTVPGMLAAKEYSRGMLGSLAGMVTDRVNAKRRLMRKLEADLMADPDVMCLPVSRHVAEEIRCYYGPRPNVRVVYNAADCPDPDMPERAQWRAEQRKVIGAKDDETVFLTIATNFRLKGVQYAISALGKLNDDLPDAGARMVVVGKEDDEAYRSWAERRGVAGRVHFSPPTREVWRWYAAADAVVLLSWYDPCSRVVLEALRWGIPAMTTRLNGASEVLNAAGVTVDLPCNVEAVADGMATMCSPQTRQEMARHARKIGDGLTMARHVDKLEQVYREVMEQQ